LPQPIIQQGRAKAHPLIQTLGNMYVVCIGNIGAEHIMIRLTSNGAGDDIWLVGDIEIQVQSFVGKLSAYFEPYDFSLFSTQLTQLHSSLTGAAILKPREEQLVLTLTGNGRGGINVSGIAYSQATWQNKLEFSFEIDQTFLLEPLAQLEVLSNAIA